jgi:hypothetical protein
MSKAGLSKLVLAILFAVCAGRMASAQHYSNTGPVNAWTTRKVSRVNDPDGQLRIVRAAKQAGFDRVVFEFADGVPSFFVNYTNAPIYQEETMTEVKISGTAFIEVSFQFYYGEHAEIYKGYPKGKLDLPSLLEMKNIDSSESVMAFAFGLQGRHAFRVQTLTNPARLVVDIKH